MNLRISSEDVRTYYSAKATEVIKKFGCEPEEWFLEWLDNLPAKQMRVRLMGRAGKREKCSSNFPGIPHHVQLLISTEQL